VNVEWGSQTNNPTREEKCFWTWQQAWTSCFGDTPTYARGEVTSIIDVTFSKDVEINGWAVLDDFKLSDHAYVVFSLDPPPADLHPGFPNVVISYDADPGWALKKPLINISPRLSSL